MPVPARLDETRIAAARFGNDAAWYRDRIPFFDSSDPAINAVYYYRWSIVRAHQRDLGAQGFVTTEFLDDVPWQRDPYATLNDASGFHLGELRWLRDRRYAADYIDYMYEYSASDPSPFAGNPGFGAMASAELSVAREKILECRLAPKRDPTAPRRNPIISDEQLANLKSDFSPRKQLRMLRIGGVPLQRLSTIKHRNGIRRCDSSAILLWSNRKPIQFTLEPMAGH